MKIVFNDARFKTVIGNRLRISLGGNFVIKEMKMMMGINTNLS